MREPGADIVKIYGDYNEAVYALYQEAKHDGVNGEDITRDMRTIVGQISENHPEYESLFEELRNEGLEKAPYERVYRYEMTEDGEDFVEKKVWRGEYIMPDGHLFTGGFNPAQPKSKAEWFESFKDKFTTNLVAKGDINKMKSRSEEMRGNFDKWQAQMMSDNISSVDAYNILESAMSCSMYYEWFQVHPDASFPVGTEDWYKAKLAQEAVNRGFDFKKNPYGSTYRSSRDEHKKEMEDALKEMREKRGFPNGGKVGNEEEYNDPSY